MKLNWNFLEKFGRRLAIKNARRQFADCFGSESNSEGRFKGYFIIFDGGSRREVSYLIYLYRLLQELGYKIVVIGWNVPEITDYYRMIDGIIIHYWHDFTPALDPGIIVKEGLSAQNAIEAKALEYRNVRLGLHALSESTRRYYFDSKSDIKRSPESLPECFTECLVQGIQAIQACEAIFQKYPPAMATFGDACYLLQGAAYDYCLSQKVPALHIGCGMVDQKLILKRSYLSNRDHVYCSVSDKSWDKIKELPWNSDSSKKFHKMHRDNYQLGTWCSLAGQNRRTKIIGGSPLLKQLGLDPQKKTAIIFPHILWDAPLYFGENLFSDYGEWLLEVVGAALKNPHVNWIIKLHPGNVFCHHSKDHRLPTKSAELDLLHAHFGGLPDSIGLIPPDSGISTYSLFPIMDYCLTVRGTVGYEAAAHGIPAITAGTGYYSDKGFTINSSSKAEYLNRLETLHCLPRMTDCAKTLAEKFTFSVMGWRHFCLTSLQVSFQSNKKVDLEMRLNIPPGENLRDQADIKALVNWITESEEEDYLDDELLKEYLSETK